MKPIIGIIGKNEGKFENDLWHRIDVADEYRHKINIRKDTMLYNLVGKETIEVNSIHSMIATKELVEPFATISSFSDDGLVESFELPNKKFVMGIKWHPELLLDEEYVNKLFRKFIDNCWK